MDRFTEDGRLIIPLTQRRQKDEDKVRYVLEHAYCPKGCSIIDTEHKINGYPGLKVAFKRPGSEGVLVLSAIEGDFTKTVLTGELAEGVKDELYCPHCGVQFPKLVNCRCSGKGDMVVIGLTPELDFNNAVTFCNVTGCPNGASMKSGDVLLHMRLGDY